jgi:protein O-mannosyl-transferase
MKASRPAAKPKKRGSIGARTSKPAFTPSSSIDPQLIVIIGLIVLVFLCYADALGNQFVFDDFYVVYANQRIHSISMALFSDIYRPFRDLSYAFDVAIWGEQPFGFHLTNVIIHAANVLLVFVLVRTIARDLATSTLAALIFAVHPIQTDAVAYISGRRDLLFAFFYISAFLCYLAYYRNRWSPWAVLALFSFAILWVFSVLSKEMAMTLPIVIFVWHYCDEWKETEGNWWKRSLQTAWKAFSREKVLYLVMVTGGLIVSWYLVFVRGASLLVTRAGIKYWGGSFYSNALTVFRVHAWYLKQLVYPTPITQYLGAFEPSQTIFEWRVIVSLTIVGAVLCGGFLLLGRERLMSFSVLSYFVFLLPVSQIIPHHELLADHYLYLPMASFGLFASLLTKRVSDSGLVIKKAPYVLAGAIIVLFAVMTVVQNRNWKDERTLWTANYEALPNSPRAALNLGNTYQDTEPQKAEELFKRALELSPTADIRKRVYDRMAVVLIQQKRYEEAEFYVTDILQKSPQDFFGNLWMTQINLGRKECDKAKKTFVVAQSAASKPREISLSEETRFQLEQQCGQ